MVAWSDGSDSSEYIVEYMSSASDDDTIKVPASTEVSNFEGPKTDMYVLCHGHRKAAKRHVAFEGIHTGRRFLCCAEKEGKKCGLVEWIDPSWPSTLENALSKLWFMYEQSKRDMDLTEEKKETPGQL
ncbi:hypothetical protein VPH35_047815 [Triticum aestivum]